MSRSKPIRNADPTIFEDSIGQKGLPTKQSKTVKPAEIQVEIDPCYSTQSEQLILTDVTNTNNRNWNTDTKDVICNVFSRKNVDIGLTRIQEKNESAVYIDASSKNLIRDDRFEMFCKKRSKCSFSPEENKTRVSTAQHELQLPDFILFVIAYKIADGCRPNK